MTGFGNPPDLFRRILDIGHDDHGAIDRELPRRGQADPACGTGNDGCLPCKPHGLISVTGGKHQVHRPRISSSGRGRTSIIHDTS